ncbi:neutral alpha-glucosidase AB-like isoform X3 [Pomacea canaliculata]|uniref:neutral alpha-glucosidase AB-like isoform X3 n=1 Tax=Pomacea canaliculata TaxID=400727 RepID=UPI000D736A2C|nr:neutral alpha-glucosidase AB-like isoform X3 [Pomacea canaliculata]
MRIAQLLLGLLVVGLESVLAVQRDNFRTCSQVAYCRRHRALEPGPSSYAAQPESLRLSQTSAEINVLNKETGVRFVLTISGIKDNTFRIRLVEAEPLRQRFEPPIGDVLVKEPEGEEMIYKGRSGSQLTFTKGSSRLILTTDPLRIDIFSDDNPVVSINARGLLNFEHTREKKGWVTSLTSSLFSWFSQPFREPAAEDTQQEEKKEETENNEEEKTEKKKEEESDLWEETFKSFTESKPFGPTSVGVDISFPGVEYVYGIPEHAESLALKTTKSTDPYRLFNLDVFEYELYNPMALYGSVPLMIAHNEKRTLSVFWLNAAETWVDIRSNVADKSVFSNLADFVTGNNEVPQTDTHWFSESGIIDIFIMLGPGPKDVFRQYAALTGTTPLPPLFSIGYHQCRWNYNDQEDVRSVDENFDKFDLPYDVIWLDIEHADGKRYFTWDASKFPNSEEMLRNISSKGRKMVTIVDPHLKRDDNFKVYAEGRDKGLFVKTKDGQDFDGWCWPGSSSWPDFMEPHVRDWWASKFALSEYPGSALNLYTWNDMNEPSVFNGPEITFSRDQKHLAGWENREVHNVYGMHVHAATMEGLLRRTNHQERAFVLTRAFFAGSQRTAAVWTGDNMGEWGHLKVSNPMILSLNLVGIVFSGADIGGFFKNPDIELQTRWFQAGAFQPFARSHAHLDTKRREPYLLPEENVNIVRSALRARYSYLPYWYTQFYLSEKTGAPVMQPLWVEFPGEKATFNIDDVYLIGPALLVRPVTDQGAVSANVYFPGADELWYDVDTWQVYKGQQEVNVPAPLSKIPVYQRGGYIIPRKMRPRRSSTLTFDDPFTLVVCLDAKQESAGQLYVDDYHSFRYRDGDFGLVNYTFQHHKLHSIPIQQDNQFTTSEWLERVMIIGLPHEPKSVTLNSSGETKDLGFTYDSSTKILVIRKPGVNILLPWTITLH